MKLANALAANAANNIAKPAVLISPVAAMMNASTTESVPVALASFSRRFIVYAALRLKLPAPAPCATMAIDLGDLVELPPHKPQSMH